MITGVEENRDTENWRWLDGNSRAVLDDRTQFSLMGNADEVRECEESLLPLSLLPIEDGEKDVHLCDTDRKTATCYYRSYVD